MPAKVEYLVVDTTAFIQNAHLQDVSTNIITTQSVVDEIKNKRQLRRLVALPYDLVIKDAFSENIKIITEFAKKTGDYPTLSATDISIIALTYQLEKEKVGTEHLRTEPIVSTVKVTTTATPSEDKKSIDLPGFYQSQSSEARDNVEFVSNNEESKEETENPKHEEAVENKTPLDVDDILVPIHNLQMYSDEEGSDSYEEYSSGDDEGWITPGNVQKAKQQIDADFLEEKPMVVACMTTDFAMQNVLKQMNLNVSALDGRIIKQLKTYILRCYACFKTTSVMTKAFCPNCGNNTLKRVGVSLDENGKQIIHINGRRPLTARGKKYSLPRIKGGKHSNNPILVADQPMPNQRPTQLARTKNNPLDDDYIAGFSPFIMRDINSKSAQLKIRPNTEVKHWMRKNPNEARRKRK